MGLPHEDLTLFEGNLYVRPHGPSERPGSSGPSEPDPTSEPPWRISRKTDPAANPRWENIQRSVWQPVYHSRYRPLDGGIADDGDRAVRGAPWRNPWTPERPGQWSTRGTPGYAFTPSAPRPSGTLAFDWSIYPTPGLYYPYNLTLTRDGLVRGQPIEDVRLAATLQPAGEDATRVRRVRPHADPHHPRPAGPRTQRHPPGAQRAGGRPRRRAADPRRARRRHRTTRRSAGDGRDGTDPCGWSCGTWTPRPWCGVTASW